jgi:hypothetical protein
MLIIPESPARSKQTLSGGASDCGPAESGARRTSIPSGRHAAAGPPIRAACALGDPGLQLP